MIARDNVLAIIGPATTIEVAAVGPLVNEKEVPLLTNSPSADVRKFGKWSFNVTAAPADIMLNLAKYGVEKMKIKRVAMVAARENETFQTQKNVVRDYWKANGVTILLVEQNLHFAQRLGDTVAVMDNGRVVHAGSMQELSGDPALQRSLLGLAL